MLARIAVQSLAAALQLSFTLWCLASNAVIYARACSRLTKRARELRYSLQRRLFNRTPDSVELHKSQLAAIKTLGMPSKQGSNAACSCLSTVQFANGPKRSMGLVLGAKKLNFLIRGRRRPTVCGGRAGGILSIPAK